MPGHSQSIHTKLNHLHDLLVLLPHRPSPTNTYDFRNFSVNHNDPNFEDLGAFGILNRRLEAVFATNGHSDGPCPFKIKQSGPGTVAVVDSLWAVLSMLDPSDGSVILLEKWIDDFIKAAIYEVRTTSIGFRVTIHIMNLREVP